MQPRFLRTVCGHMFVGSQRRTQFMWFVVSVCLQNTFPEDDILEVLLNMKGAEESSAPFQWTDARHRLRSRRLRISSVSATKEGSRVEFGKTAEIDRLVQVCYGAPTHPCRCSGTESRREKVIHQCVPNFPHCFAHQVITLRFKVEPTSPCFWTSLLLFCWWLLW